MIWWRRSRSAPKAKSAGPKIVRLPEHIKTVYAIGDVHGCQGLAQKAEDLIGADSDCSPDSAAIIYLGDLVDRGPDTAFLLDLMLARKSKEPKRYFIRGNHEAMMEAFLEDPGDHMNWLDFGGYETLNSYGILNRLDALHRMRSKDLANLLATSVSHTHKAFLSEMIDAVDATGFFFCHAGVDPDKPLAEQENASLHWARNRFMAHEGGFEKTIVHGHTPIKAPVHAKGRVSIDTGAYLTGRLTVAKISLATGKVEFIVATKDND